jgi:hypothetical protein
LIDDLIRRTIGRRKYLDNLTPTALEVTGRWRISYGTLEWIPQSNSPRSLSSLSSLSPPHRHSSFESVLSLKLYGIDRVSNHLFTHQHGQQELIERDRKVRQRETRTATTTQIYSEDSSIYR